MINLVLLLMCVAFVEVMRLVDIRRQVDITARVSRESLAVVRSSTMSDEEKEHAMQRGSLTLFKQTGLFVVKLVAVLLGPAALYLIAVHVAGVDPGRLNERLMSPLVWLAMTAAAALYVWIRHAVASRL